MPSPLRPMRREDAERAREIERRAGEQFRAIDMADVAEHEPASVAELVGYVDAGRAWVAIAEELDDPIGYVLVDIVDGNAHVEQVSVLPERQGEGVGRALLEQVHEWAKATARTAITLTTFRHVAWNQPLYEHLGFVVLREDEIGPELARRRDDEAAHGLDPDVRACMRREV